MRKVTQNIVGVISLGVLATSWSLGQAAETGLSMDSATQPAAPVESGPIESPSTESTPNQTVPTESAAATSPTEPVQAATPTKTSAPAATKKPATASGSKTGDPVTYKYGVIQLEVVKSGSTITAVNLIQSGTKGPDWAVVPGMLADAAVSANGSSFGNVSGATFTTQAFKTALESALAKF